MHGTSGLLLIGIGVLHTVFGLFQGYRVLARISGATFSTEAGRQLVTALGRQFVFWFLFGGFLMLVLGHVFTWVERRLDHRVPAVFGWELLVLAMTGLAVMPRSGFWLVLAVAIYTIVGAHRAKRTEA